MKCSRAVTHRAHQANTKTNLLHLRRYLIAAGCAVSATLLSTVSQAESYRVELNAGGAFSDMDLRTQTTGYTGSVTYYLQPVQTVASIFAESAFINKSSSATLGYTGANTDFGLTNSEADADSLDLSARYVLNEKYILEASVAEGEVDPEGAAKTDISSFGFGVGRYIDDLTSIVLRYTQDDIEGESTERDSVIVTLKSIVDPTETDRAVGIVSLGVTQNDIANTITNFDASLDYYLGPRLSIGAAIGLVFPNNGADENAYGLRSEYFITDWISVSASYTHTIFQEEENQASIDGTDTFMFGLKGRI